MICQRIPDEQCRGSEDTPARSGQFVAWYHQFMLEDSVNAIKEGSKSKVKSYYFIVRPKVDQRAGLLSLPHLGNLAVLHVHNICLYFVSIHQRATPVLNDVHF